MRRWICWVLCIIAAAIPLFLFVTILSLFGVGDRELQTVTEAADFNPAILRPYAAARLGIVSIEYGWWVFAHVLLSITVGAYFATLLAGHAERESKEVLPRMVTVGVFIVCLIGFLTFLVLTPVRSGGEVETQFANLVIAPYYYFLTRMDLSAQFADFGGDPWSYLSLSALGPTAFGILCVTLASGVFHHDVLCRRRIGTEGWEKDVAACLRSLKTYAAVLSLILVSSTLTARTYFHIVPNLLAPPSKDDPGAGAIYTVYSDFAGTISTASGLLFTMTLIAAFAPGLIMLLRDVSGAVRNQEEGNRQSLLETLGLTDLRTNLSTLLKIGLTIASPALASPIAEVFQSL